ncbi:MucB/RseB C-terminal domain-containing protein [Marinobacter sp. C2H3]|uniref:MucB/RseB C-terminal domain-containing protein n=1 Tax=Marinobacter sp. C2H3 TaxID=3119003 RepID=UPI00300F28BC
MPYPLLMPCRSRATLATLMLTLLCLALPVSARAEGARTAAEWLARLGPALNTTSYRGVFVYARGDQVQSMQIAHRFRDGMVEERLVMQDGGAAEIVRRGADVVCVLPDQGRVRLDQVVPSGPFAEAVNRSFMPGDRWYDTRLMGHDRVAGHKAVRITLAARDRYRYSHELWLESDTGLLVKSQVQDADGRVLEHFQFTSLTLTDDFPEDAFTLPGKGRETRRMPTDGTNAVPGPAAAPGESSPGATTRMDDWRLGWRPDGFEPAATPPSARQHAVAYSDGLASFSVFVEPARARDMPEGVSRIGATTVFGRVRDSQDHRYRITVVGEIPPEAARRIAEAVTMRGPGGS